MATSLEFLKMANGNAFIKAAQKTIRTTEGTNTPDGYNYLFGSSPKNDIRFSGYATHPNILETENGYSTTAAGAYQILSNTFVELCNEYGFTDFSPATQDLMFCALLDQKNCLQKVVNGYFMTTTVQTLLGEIWASLPLSPYGQPTHTLIQVADIYKQNGGEIITV